MSTLPTVLRFYCFYFLFPSEIALLIAHGSWGLCGIYSNGIGSDRVLLYAVLEDANQNKEDSYIYVSLTTY